jgi:hypothetical protein
MGIFDRLFGGRKREDEVEHPQEFPWDRSPSVYEHIRAHIEPGKPGLTSGGEDLPDEEQIASTSKIRWAAGAMDGVLTHHMGGGAKEDNVSTLLDRVRTFWTTPTALNKAEVYNFVVENGIIGMLDAFIEQLTQQEDVNHDRLYDLVRSFATEASDREPVKFGIALLSLYGQPQDFEIFRTLGRHDEFTLFCAVALSNAVEDCEQELWDLAKNVEGWGRVQIVERLADTENPDIKEWMLREGYRNKVMYEYLAYTCATTGGLLEALSRDSIDDDLLTSTAEIIQALIIGGPAEDIDDYDDGAVAVELYLGNAERLGTTLLHFLTVASISDFLGDEDADWSARAERGWTAEKRSAMRAQCEAIIAAPGWQARVNEGLRSVDEQTFHNADRAAQVLGIDTWKFHWERLQAKPLEAGRWFHVMTACNDERIDDAVALAERHLPLEKIAAGPADEMGMGPGWEAHGCLDFILQELGRFPGKGIRLIEVGLRSPVTRNRNMALRAFSEWGEENWPDSMAGMLQRAMDDEPDGDVRERMRKVKEGEAWE